ncbi:MAG: copper amine oxidase N-terminal domain-containing protein [Desulfitobacteriaceae bacterium]|nr:copper amine oxidase N-terminal domain-containing protein [Desulfitobacteriaceae bacterium]MDD4753562.1 copper amine oxidase N-terminal domain-containing protein [Desulfitobacteriaceae bacterium]
MKKSIGVLMLAFVLLLTVSVGTFAVLPGYEDYKTQYKIADYTIEFLEYYGARGTATFAINNDPDLTNDEVIEEVLKGCWTMNETYIYQITHVNGIPIEQTKWAKYGGVIQHVGGNYEFSDDPQEQVLEQKEVTVFINGKQIIFPDQKPIIIRGRTMVPMRAIFEHVDIQAEVKWNDTERTVIATDRSGKTIVFRIDDENYRVQEKGKESEFKSTDVAPIIENGRTLLPLRALSESLDFKVDWIDKERKVEITENEGKNRRLLSPERWQKYLKKGGNAK